MKRPFDNGSYWFDSLDVPVVQTPKPLPDEVDVAIIGAGFTGLWTAYYLKKADPSLTIAILESNTVGYGASGRNGGWCMGWSMGIDSALAKPSLREAGLATARAMQDTVDEIGRICQAENIDCHFAKGGTLTVATTPVHATQLQQQVKHLHQAGLDEDDFVWLDATAAAQRINMTPNYGAMYTPHCASIHPARLVRGLGDRVSAAGVSIFEQTPVSAYQAHQVTTNRGQLRAGVILRATEGYTVSIEGRGRDILPLYSMMVATEPLPEQVWDQIGLRQRETFGDARRVVIYGQRTQDNRIAFGGRAGYYFGSKLKGVIPEDDPHFVTVEQTLRDLFPMLSPYKITHRWGGLMGAPRHWRPFVSFDPATGLGAAGGYTGEGVGASNLAGRVLCDLVTGKRSPLTALPWVGDTPPRWEPEPLRWLGASAIQHFGDLADRSENSTGKPSAIWGRLFDQFVG